MAKQYKRRNNGLYLADDAIAVPKAGQSIPRPWWSSPYVPTAARATSQIKFVGDPPQILFVGDPPQICFNPECCCITDCMKCTMSDQYDMVADLGAGGWTDNWCDGCDEVQGTYVMTGAFVASPPECTWLYQTPDWCLIGALQFYLKLYLQIQAVGGSQWKWHLSVSIFNGSALYAAGVGYDSANYSNGDDCFVGEDGGGLIAMTKVGENTMSVCSGSMPSSVSIYRN